MSSVNLELFQWVLTLVHIKNKQISNLAIMGNISDGMRKSIHEVMYRCAVACRTQDKLNSAVVISRDEFTVSNSDLHASPSEYLQDFAELDPAFHGNFSCPRRFNSVGLDGAVRALCRICKNISEPANGLVLNRSAQCLPQSFQALYRDLGCLATEFLNYRYHEECRDMFFPNSDSSSVVAKGPVDSNSTDNTHSLRFLSMAFRSVSCRCKFSNNAEVEVRELSEFTLYAL